MLVWLANGSISEPFSPSPPFSHPFSQTHYIHTLTICTYICLFYYIVLLLSYEPSLPPKSFEVKRGLIVNETRSKFPLVSHLKINYSLMKFCLVMVENKVQLLLHCFMCFNDIVSYVIRAQALGRASYAG